jgi:aldehyde dehydrogenase (NAD+)
MVAEAAAKTLTPVVLELGGKSPCVVDRTADIGVACRRIVWGGFFNAGQTCVRPDYILVDDTIADAFFIELKKTVKKFYGDNPKDSEYFGRLINTRAAERVKGLLEQSAGKIVVGGENSVADRYCAPTIVDFGSDVTAFETSAVMAEELFAPILPVLRYTGGLDQVIGFINDREKPLVLYAFTDDSTTQTRLKNETSSVCCVPSLCI